jgi:glycosyltransferase involved in cell wall biosynthesis
MLTSETTVDGGILRFENRRRTPPAFSICIPQYNRTSFVLQCLESFRQQTFQNVEICVSDGGSNDGGYEEIVRFLFDSTLSFSFVRHEQNFQYDANLRVSMGLARGRYCFLCGNDDMLSSPSALEKLHRQLEVHGFPEVVITNYRELSTGNTYRRITRTHLIGSGPFVAANNFRNFSFVSGILLDRVLAHKHATDAWDGSEMYQMFVGSRIISEGGRLLGVDDTVVLKDIQIPNESVDSYARKAVLVNCPIRERRLPLCLYPRVAFAAVAPFLNSRDSAFVLRRILTQVLIFTYPPWLLEYRRVQSWRYAVGVGLAMRPKNLLFGLEVGWWTNLYARVLHMASTAAGLAVPHGLYKRARRTLYAVAKRYS